MLCWLVLCGVLLVCVEFSDVEFLDSEFFWDTEFLDFELPRCAIVSLFREMSCFLVLFFVILRDFTKLVSPKSPLSLLLLLFLFL